MMGSRRYRQLLAKLRRSAAPEAELLQEIARLETRVTELQRALDDLERNSARRSDDALKFFAQLSGKLVSLDAAIDANRASVQGIYSSRIWRSLQTVGGTMLKLRSLFGLGSSRLRSPSVRVEPALPSRRPDDAEEGDRETVRLFCDEPAEGQRLPHNSMIKIRGWALAESGIDRVEVAIGGRSPMIAAYGLERLDVLHGEQEGFSGATYSGFELWWPTSMLRLGKQEIIFTAVSGRGARVSLGRGIQVIAEPADAFFRFCCDFPHPGLLAPIRDLVEVRGWAMAAAGIDRVEVHCDGQFLGIAEYGRLRPDVAEEQPDFPNAGRSGFSFPWDATGLSEGRHTLHIRAVSKSGETREATAEVLLDPLWIHEYRAWIQSREAAEQQAAVEEGPLISVVVPVWNTPLPFLRRCVESVRSQSYANWELCLADDGSGSTEITRLLEEYSMLDARIRFVTLAVNGGISRATNEAARLARGDYVAFLDHDDELASCALSSVAQAIHANPDTDLFYSDEDKIDEQGGRFEPFFKPDWSPDLFLACNYLCHFVVCRRSVYERVGGLREEYRHGSQDYDFLLRVTETTQRIKRIPRVLYHWRAAAGSTALTAAAKPEASQEGQRALADHLSRTVPGALVEEIGAGRYRVRYALASGQRVTIVMPTGGNLSMLDPVLADLFTRTSYPHLEVLLVDNSKNGAVQECVHRWQRKHANIRCIDRRGEPFNYSRLNNEAVRETDAPLILFLNDDMTVINEDWLAAIVEHGQRRDVGAVGSLLLYPHGAIQHAGVALGIYNNSGHLFRGLWPKPGAYFDLPVLPRNCSAVTAACLLTRREVFWEVGGFDEENLAVAFQDVDLCLKIRACGYRVVYTPFSRLYHHESVTKAEKVPNPKEVEYMQATWKSVIEDDPYYNPNLSRRDEHYNLRFD